MMENWKGIVLKKINELDRNKEILKNLDETTKEIDFSDCIKQHKKQNLEDEAYIRTYLVLKLIKELQYSCDVIELEKEYSIGRPSTKKARLDILVKRKEGDPFMLVECKTPDKFDKEKNEAIQHQLFAIAKQEINGNKKPKYLVLYTINIENGEVADRAIIIDFEQYQTYEDWKEAGEPSLDEIPTDYHIAKKYTYANIDKPDPNSGLKPLRKDYTLADFEKLRLDLHNKLWAGGEADYNDIFYHLIKIMLVRIYDELYTAEGEPYKFQIFYKNDKPETPEELAQRLEQMYKDALRDLLNYDDEEIKKIPFIELDKFTYEKLFYVVQKLQEISLTENTHSKEEDVLGLFFESILQNEFKQSKGQYFTHKNIVRFLIYALELDKLTIDKLNQTYPHFPYIIDPAAGSGTFLIEAMKIITKEVLKNKDKLKMTRSLKEKIIKDLEDPNRKHHWAEDYIYGIEPNARLGLATKVNMILHGDGNMNIFIEDGLMPFKINGKPFYTRKWKGKDIGLLAESEQTSIYPKPINARFDVVISNPPFSMEIEAMRSHDYIKDTFVFYDKKNSENLFIERWFQLLAPKGRLGVVLPESVFDTKENLYIRNFLYKYFKIKAIISLPKEAFEPYTSTKVSLLIAERKTDEEIEKWEEKWRECSEEYKKLRDSKIIQFFIENDKILNSFRKFLERYNIEIDYSKILVYDLLDENLKKEIEDKLSQEDKKKEDKKKFEDLKKKIETLKNKYKLENMDTEENKNILKRFLKQFYPEEEQFKSFKEILEYVYDDVLEIATLDYPQIPGENNYCNSWWVFGEVSKHFNYPIFYAEVENIGYKRTKRGEQDKDIPIKDENGNIVAFKNDLFKVKAEKVKKIYWVKKGDEVVQEEKEEIIKTDIMINTENPETVLDYLRKADIWSDKPKFAFMVE
jgi:type I restriction enzyme M protein